jgi:hypothetical protein
MVNGKNEKVADFFRTLVSMRTAAYLLAIKQR